MIEDRVIPGAAGFMVLVELLVLDKKIDGTRIEYTREDHTKEQAGRIVCIVRDIGPIAYKGFDCTADEWGTVVGEIAILAGRYQGSKVAFEGPYQHYRIVPDSAIVGRNIG